MSRGSEFQVQVVVEAGPGRPVDAAQVYLDFDPARLQALSLTPGQTLEYHLEFQWDDNLGELDCAAGAVRRTIERPFVLCTIAFRAIAASDTIASDELGTLIQFADRTQPRATKVVRRGVNVTGRLTPVSVMVHR